MRNGVKASINTIAVQTLEKVGVTAAYQFATENLGLSLAPEDMNVSPLGLGGLTYGLSTVEMAAAYAAFANSGCSQRAQDLRKVLANDNSTVVLEKGDGAAGGHEGDHRLSDDGHAAPGGE